MKTILATIALLGTGATLAAACTTEEVRIASATVGPRHSAASAAQTIAETECDREQRCGNIGKDRSFASRRECFQAKVKPLSEELADPDCDDNGVGDSNLDECLEQVNSRACSAIYTAGFWEELIDCGSGNLCLE